MKRNTISKIIGVWALIILTGYTADCQISIGTAPPPPAVKEDTTKPIVRVGIKPYEKVITKDFISKKGLFTVHQDRDKIYFEIPDSILLRDIMVVNRLTKVAALHGMYAGEELDQKTIHFEKGPDSSIRVRYKLIINEADSSNDIYKAVIKSSNDPIAVSFPVIAYGNKTSVVDVSRFLKDRTAFVNSMDPNSGLAKNVNTGAMKDFYIEAIRAYPINVEIRISKTMESKAKALPVGTPATIETNTSFILLPKQPMQRRYFDERVGYFADYYYAYGDEQQKTEMRQFIVRWRLEPKAADMEKWKRGELVEPQKPIVIYIDPATPKQWRPYLIAGINDWQKAFEQAGFKNAIVGKEWPEKDTTMDMEDVRYSMVSYLPSEIANAYGPNVHDPRSGEIIQTHIGWFHNVMEILHSWYMVQAAAVDPRARKAIFDDELMGQLIRFVSSHEVGHTLGLRHNFGNSSQTPVDSLRNKSYLEKYGHTASIMDYARFNYVIQPEDKPEQKHLFPRIGEYDKWAIEWGYKFINAPSPEEDKKTVRKWIEKRTAENPRLWFGDGEVKRFDPRCQTEDLGDNAMKASTYGIKNLQRILPNLPAWTAKEDGLNEELGNMYRAVKDQYFRYMLHVLKNVGGVRYTVRTDNEKAAAYEPVPKEMQQEALQFFNEQLFKTPYWLLDKNVMDKVTLPEGVNFVEDIQARVLNSLLDISVLNKLMTAEKQFGNKALALNEYFSAIHKGIWQEVVSSGAIKMDSYRRNLQKTYLGALIDIIANKDATYTETDASSMIKAELLQLQNEIKLAIPRTTDTMTLYHFKDLQERIKTALNPKI